MARLHGFPDWFRFHITKWHGARQVGNAVPPPLARAIAESIVIALDVHPERPDEPIGLGHPALLRMDMSRASEHWSVAVPIGKRDRKSGARKRKQRQVEACLHPELDIA
jgi:DNA (cytosine-5)-methyltransferase 1